MFRKLFRTQTTLFPDAQGCVRFRSLRTLVSIFTFEHVLPSSITDCSCILKQTDPTATRRVSGALAIASGSRVD